MQVVKADAESEKGNPELGKEEEKRRGKRGISGLLKAPRECLCVRNRVELSNMACAKLASCSSAVPCWHIEGQWWT